MRTKLSAAAVATWPKCVLGAQVACPAHPAAESATLFVVVGGREAREGVGGAPGWLHAGARATGRRQDARRRDRARAVAAATARARSWGVVPTDRYPGTSRSRWTWSW